jgi:primosomal replication protein N
MKHANRMLLTFLTAASLISARVFAHHSFAAEFDRNKPVTLAGVVTKLELASPNGLMRAGWSRHSVQVGDKITVKGFLAKDGSRLANAANVTSADGKTILSEATVNESKN